MTADLCDAELIDLDEQGGGHRRDGTAAPRWAPDMQLVPAILMTPRWPRVLTEYVEADRCWIVAGVDLANWSAKEIQHRIGGSERLVRDLRSKPFTELCKLMQSETQKLADQLRLEQIEHVATQHLLRQATRTVERLAMQRDQLLAAHMTGELSTFRCGHPKVRYNIYQHGGRSYCRQCRTDRQTTRRQTLTCIVVNR